MLRLDWEERICAADLINAKFLWTFGDGDYLIGYGGRR